MCQEWSRGSLVSVTPRKKPTACENKCRVHANSLLPAQKQGSQKNKSSIPAHWFDRTHRWWWCFIHEKIHYKKIKNKFTYILYVFIIFVLYIYIYTYIHTHTHIDFRLFFDLLHKKRTICIYVCIYIYMHIYRSIYICIYIYILYIYICILLWGWQRFVVSLKT